MAHKITELTIRCYCIVKTGIYTWRLRLRSFDEDPYLIFWVVPNCSEFPHPFVALEPNGVVNYDIHINHHTLLLPLGKDLLQRL